MEILGLIDVPVWLLLILFLVLTLYWYTSSDHGYFKSIGIPGPKPKPFIGNTLDFLFEKGGFAEYDFTLKKKYGNVIGTFFPGSTRSITVFDEEMISEITVKKFSHFTNRPASKSGVEIFDNNLLIMKDHVWKRTRSTMSPAFTTGKLRKMAHEINRCAKQLTSNLASMEDFDAKESTSKFAMDVIASTAFGLRINSQEDEENVFVTNSKKLMNFSLVNPLVLIRLLLPKLAKYLGKMGFSGMPNEALQFFGDFIAQTFDNRRSGASDGKNDFVQLMVNAQAGDDIRDAADKEDTDADSQTKSPPEGLSNVEIVSNAFLFFLAGFHTSSAGIRFLMYELARNPECQEKLIEEIEREVGDQEDVTYDMVSRMVYLDKCLCESLRMYPPAPRLNRIVDKPVTINNVLFEKGTNIIVPVMAIQNDPDIWPEPEKFDPERFNPEEKAKRSPFHWMPFGYGPRNCIGMRLALFEIKVAIVQMLREHKLVKCAKTEDPIVFLPSRYQENKAGLWLKLEKRK